MSKKKFAVAMPVPAGGRDRFKKVAAEALGARREQHDASRRRLGVSSERCWIQGTPMGDFMILLLEGADPVRANVEFAASQDSYDVWFKASAGAALGADFSQPIPVRPELVFESTTGVSKQAVAVITPLLPGKTAAWQRMVEEVKGPRRAAHQDFSRRLGVQEDWFFQPTPAGDLKIIYLESDDLGAAISGLASSTAPHDVWFKQSLLDVDGIDWSKPLPGPLPEEVLNWRE